MLLHDDIVLRWINDLLLGESELRGLHGDYIYELLLVTCMQKYQVEQAVVLYPELKVTPRASFFNYRRNTMGSVECVGAWGDMI